MNTFLEQLAEELLMNGGNDFSNTCIVLPNRRAGVFLRDAISRKAKKAIWAPAVLSIEDFIFQLSDHTRIEQATLLFTCFEVYKQTVTDAQSLELFANWAPAFLADINELDINLIDAEDIYAQLYSVERIEKWNPGGGPVSDFQARHLAFVKQLHQLYAALRTELSAKKLAYQGMAFRAVAEDAERHLKAFGREKIWFAGFNALTTSEEELIKSALELGFAQVFWDMDAHYADNPFHEAGLYLRKYREGKSRLKLNDDFRWKNRHLSDHPKEIHVVGAQRNMGQVDACATILQQKLNDPTTDFSKVAVVLNDEKLLFPLLSKLPTELKGINITMGYGLRYSQSATFIDKLFQLHINVTDPSSGYYYKDLLAVQTDGIYLSVNRSNGADQRATILQTDRSFLPAELVSRSAFDRIIFATSSHTVVSFLDMLQAAMQFIRSGADQDLLAIESKFLRLLERTLRRITELQNEFGAIATLKTLHVFWLQLINGQQLDFLGEPISGLQVMGMLETRNLDFQELIVLGVNEGSLPSNAHSNSFFTFDIRRAFGLACQNERDSVTAYHFYRLLQRAQKAHLIYDQDTSALGGGELSRFVQQLKLEAGANIHFQEYGLEQVLPESPASKSISIAKQQTEMDRLVALADYGFSPSALNTYRNCPFKFYLKYVVGIKEVPKLSEDLDSAQFGIVVHDTLEHLYRTYLNRPLSVVMIEEMRTRAETVLLEQFRAQVTADTHILGKNLLALEVARMYVARVLNHDQATIEEGMIPTVLHLETQLGDQLTLNLGDRTVNVRLKGKADRIDRLSDGNVRLIDYKTGSFTNKTTTIKSKDALRSSNADNAFQLLVYSLMYSSEHGTDQPIVPTLFFLRSNQVEFPVMVEENKVKLTPAEMLEFGNSELSDILSEMFDLDMDFVQTEQKSVCEYCDFKALCQR